MSPHALNGCMCHVPGAEAGGGCDPSDPEGLIVGLDEFMRRLPAGSACKRASLRLLCDLAPSRPPAVAEAWTAEMVSVLPSLARATSSLCGPLLDLLLVASTQQPRHASTLTWPGLAEALAQVTECLEAMGGSAPPPLLNLREDMQLCVLDLVFHCPELTGRLLSALVSLVRHPHFASPLIVEHILEVRGRTPGSHLLFLLHTSLDLVG